ncbi:hypothetical protein A5784_00775 [Mycobacterium sp. 852013-50091_SCH5140682]|uniref:hypothetical protein n=1 Tax=Mycobacterium sp. 852013-50091_SCH5140682 TaxID=1834109 RepID=UPI0007EA98B3|nr:hypothetical protein [Mycobacterium sp. 852013-50091_SCH5140682]OBC09252.1 hypothetical protein A5784_00775 [Mycobacterium sp. 852013-50091_SCH5140682]
MGKHTKPRKPTSWNKTLAAGTVAGTTALGFGALAALDSPMANASLFNFSNLFNPSPKPTTVVGTTGNGNTTQKATASGNINNPQASVLSPAIGGVSTSGPATSSAVGGPGTSTSAHTAVNAGGAAVGGPTTGGTAASTTTGVSPAVGGAGVGGATTGGNATTGNTTGGTTKGGSATSTQSSTSTATGGSATSGSATSSANSSANSGNTSKNKTSVNTSKFNGNGSSVKIG